LLTRRNKLLVDGRSDDANRSSFKTVYAIDGASLRNGDQHHRISHNHYAPRGRQIADIGPYNRQVSITGGKRMMASSAVPYR